MQLADALALATQGFHLFPLQHLSKLPRLKSWQMLATRNAGTIEKWSRKYPGCGFGIFTGKFRDDAALLVVDVDNKNAKHGDNTIIALELAGREFPPTLENVTPTGGRHLVYLVEKPVKQGVDILGEGLDIRSHGGYIVAPGSVVDAGEYWTDRPASPAPAPSWIVEACGAPRAKAANRQPLPGVDPERARKRAIDYLTNDAPEAIEGAGGDHTTYVVACKLKDFGVSRDDAVELMLEHWFDGCGWTDKDLDQKVYNAFRYGNNPPGADAPEAVFEPIAPTESAHAEEVGHPFAELNKQWALVITGGGHHLLWETTDFRYNPIVEHIKEATFHRYLAHREIQIGKKSEKLTEAWMSSGRRRTYDGLVFAPERTVDTRWYNLWRGFDYQAKPAAGASARAVAAVQAWRDHILRNIARGDVALAHWFTGYMAHLIQKPYEKPLVALVLKGRKGTGKNAVIERVGALFSRNLVVADDDRYLVGNFNSHLEACLLLALDEASWAGGKKVEGKLKGLITGAKHMIERKGIEPYQVDNLTRVVILGNEQWLVPATEDERRYAVFDVGEDDMQKRSFFQEMREGMEANSGEGYSVLLDYLRSFDLSTVDVNEAPKTQGLADQKRESLSPQLQWWFDCLLEGQILGGDFAGEWPREIPTNRFREAATRHNRERGVRSWAPSVIEFNRVMKSVHKDWSQSKSSSVAAGDQTYHYNVPDLMEARQQMTAYLGGESPFPVEDVT